MVVVMATAAAQRARLRDDTVIVSALALVRRRSFNCVGRVAAQILVV